MLKMHKYMSVLLPILLCLFSQKIYSNQFGTEVSASTTISSAGLYVLGQDIQGAIIIDADNVTLDLNCYRVYDTTTTGTPVTIKSGHKNVAVINGSVVGAGASSSTAGIVIEQGAHCITIKEVIALDCNVGINFEGSSGSEVESCLISNCKVSDCSKGYVASYLIKSVFEYCQALDCTLSGFEQIDSQFNVFDKCKALKTGEGSASSEDVAGFLSSAGMGNLYRECVAEGTQKSSSDGGVKVSGLSLLSTETESKVCNCIFNSTSLVGSGNAYGIYTDVLSSSCLIQESNICNTTGNAIGVFGDSTNNVFIKNIGYENDTNFSSSITNVFTEGLLVNPNLLDNISLPGSAVFSCPSSIVTPGVYKFEGVGACCISIDSDDVTLDLQGYTLYCNIGDAIEIFSGHKNITIKNGTIRGSSSYDGILTNSACEFIHIENIDVYASDNAIHFAGDSGAEIKSCKVKNCKFDTCSKGVLSDYIIKTVFDNCQALNCKLSGFEQENSQFNVFDKCKAFKTGEGAGLSDVVSGFSSSAGTGNLYTECVAEGTSKASSNVDAYGLALLSTETESKVCNCVFNSTSLVGSGVAYGLYTEGTVSTCLIKENKVCNATGNAFGIFGDSTKNVFIENIAYENDTNFSSGVVNVFTEGLRANPNLLDNISLPVFEDVGVCPGSITSSGIYKLSTNDACCITIDADDVYLDLQGYTLQCTSTHAIQVLAGHKNITIVNGVIKSDGTSDGIKLYSGCEFVRIENVRIYDCNNGITFEGVSGLEIKSCKVIGCAFDSCNKGVLADYLIKSVFEDCIAQDCVVSGFELSSSQFNIFDKCKALKTGEGSTSSDIVAGFLSSAGTGNLYTECIAEGTNKNSSDIGKDLYGLAFLSTETESKVCNCVFNSTMLTGSGSAYGIYLGTSLLPNLTSVLDSYVYGATVRSVSWSPNGDYLAIGGIGNTDMFEVQVLGFDGTSLSNIVTATYDHGDGNAILSVDWSPDGSYLVIGGESSSIDGADVRVLSFDGSTLSGITSGTYDHGGDIGSVDWSPSGPYVAIGGSASSIDGVEIRVLSFDGSSLSDIPTATYIQPGAFVVSWSPDGNYLVTGGAASPTDGAEVRVLSFDGTFLSDIITATYAHGAAINSVEWSPDGSYVAIGGFNGTDGVDVRVLGFDGVVLSDIPAAVYDHGADVWSVAWSSNGEYLVIGGFNGVNGAEVRILGFDGNALYEVTTEIYDHGSPILSVDWAQSGPYIAVGGPVGTEGYEVGVFAPTSSPSSCLVQENKVCNTTGNAIGVFGDSAKNVFIKNVAYQNDTNYSSSIVNVFTDGLLFNPNLLDNISLPGENGSSSVVASCPGASGIISESGVYTLSITGTCCITIDADDVYLDLQGYTLNCTSTHAIQILADHKNIAIVNGSIKGDGADDGIYVNAGCELVRIEKVNIYSCNNGINFVGVSDSEIKSCKVVDCKFDTCQKGVLANYLIKSVFEYCQALNCVLSGFEQENSQFNVFNTCRAFQTGVGASLLEGVSGFSSSAGKGNLYTECLAEGTSKESGDVFGFSLLSTETESKIINSISNSTSVATGVAYGIYLESEVLSFLSPLTGSFYDHGGNILSIDWSLNGLYLAIGGGPGTGADEVRVLRFDGSSFAEIPGANYDATTVNSVAWAPSSNYLAIGESAADELRVLSFDGATLSDIVGATFDHGNIVNSVAWSPDENYVAIGGDNGTGGYEVRVFSFDGSTLTVLPGSNYDHGNTIRSVAWSPDGSYLAIGGSTSVTTEVRVLSFDGSTLTVLPGSNYNHGGVAIRSVAWSPDGNYLAIGGIGGTGGYEVRVLDFDGSSLTDIVGAVYDHGSDIFSVAWSPNGEYLLIGGNDGTGGNEVRVLSFDGSTLSLFGSDSYDHGAIIRSVDWGPFGNFLAIGGIGGTGGFEVRAFSPSLGDSIPSSCLIQENKVCNTTGWATGIVGSSANNVFIKNIAYQNDTNYSSSITNVFTDGLLFDPNLLDNISLPGSNGSSPVITSCPGVSGIISTSGVYTINGTESCCITIASDDVYLDLQGYTLTCTTGDVITIDPGYKNIVIANGSIDGNGSDDGISIGAGCELVTIKDINIYACDNALIFDGTVGSMIKSCNVKDCEFHDCNKGVFATYIKKTVFERCSAKNCVEIGFEQLYSEFNLYKKCNSLETVNTNPSGIAVGFLSSGGKGNVYKECIAEGTSVTDSDFGNNAVGFLLTGTEGDIEQESKIINCVANSTEAVITVTTTTGTSYGIQLEPILSVTVAKVTTDSFQSASVAWSPNTQYLAVGGFNSFKIMTFNGQKLTNVIIETTGTDARTLDWSPSGEYLVIGKVVDAGIGVELLVYAFDGSSLSLVASVDIGATINSVAWSPCGRYIALGKSGVLGDQLFIYSFDGSSLTLVTSISYGNTISSVSWSPDGEFLAIGFPSSLNQARVLSFDGLSLQQEAVYNHDGDVSSLQWSPNGRYLLIGGSTLGATDDVRVLTFVDSVLTSVAGYTDGNSINSVFWSPDSKYLAIATNGGLAGEELKILEFDGFSVTLVFSFEGDAFANGYISWSSGGNYLAFATLGSGTQVFDVMDAPFSCLIDSNKICNTTGYGLGVSGGESNLFIKNVGYANDTNFSYGVIPKYCGGLTGNPGLMDNLWLGN